MKFDGKLLVVLVAAVIFVLVVFTLLLQEGGLFGP